MRDRELTIAAVGGQWPTRHNIVAMLLMLCTVWVTGCGVPVTDRQKFKDEIMSEVIMTVHLQMLARGLRDQDEKMMAARNRLKMEIEDEVLRKLQMLAPDSERKVASANGPSTRPQATGAVGRAEGLILSGGKGLGDCKVKLIRVVERNTMTGLLKAYKEEKEFDTITDKDGKFTFEALPVGSYKLKWKKPGGGGWLRRLQYKPDITVEPGITAIVKTVEMARGLVSH